MAQGRVRKRRVAEIEMAKAVMLLVQYGPVRDDTFEDACVDLDAIKALARSEPDPRIPDFCPNCESNTERRYGIDELMGRPAKWFCSKCDIELKYE